MIDRFVESLCQARAPENCVNPYAGYQAGIDASPEGAEIRASHLRSYLGRRRDSARLILVAEAPGYQGARFSGIAMTCERTLLNGKKTISPDLILGEGDVSRRTSCPDAARNSRERAQGFCEPTASIVWNELVSHDLGDQTVLWNVFPFHPHKPGSPLSNRTPTVEEVTANLRFVENLLSLFPGREVVCVGNTARDHLRMLMPEVAHLRHPANGGARRFREQLKEVTGHL